MPKDPRQDKPLPDSQADQTALPTFDLPSEGDIDLGALESQAGFGFPSADVPPPAAVRVPESKDGTSALPSVNVPSEGDIDLDALGSRVGDEIPPGALTQKAPLPLPDSQFGQGALPRIELPSEGDIDLGELESRAGDDIPMASLPVSAPPVLPESQAGVSLAQFSLPSEGDINLGSLASRAGDEIPIGLLPEPPSGQSLTSWTEVIRRQREAAKAGQASAGDVRVDAPSDKDILIQFDELAPRRRTGDTSEILPGELPVYTVPSGRSESDIDLGKLGLGGGTGESEVKFDILFPPSDAAGAMPAPGKAPPLSEVDFRLATPVESPSASGIPFASFVDPVAPSGVNLGADEGPPSEGGRSSILDALLHDNASPPRGGSSASVLDFGSAPLRSPAKQTVPNAAPGPDRPAVPTRPNIDMGSKGSVPEVGGRDLVDSDPDRGSEDAIDLYAEPAPSPSITDSGTLEISTEAIEESQRKTDLQESSSIDLSSRPSYHGSDFEKALEAPSGVEIDSDSDIDLNLPAVGDEGDSSMVHRQPLEVNQEALKAEFKARREAREKAETKTRRKEVVPARAGGQGGSRGHGALIAGSVVGLVLGAGAVLGAYFAGVLPNRGPAAKGTTAVADNSAEVTKLKQDADSARKDAADAKADVARQVDEARQASANQIQTLTNEKAASDAEARRLAGEAQKAKADLTTAVKAAADAKTAEQAATNNLLAAATKATDDARKELMAAMAAKKTADESLAALNKSLADAGLDPAKPGEALKQLMAARTTAETKAKEADAKLAESTKKITELTTVAETAKKSHDDARKAAEEAVKARDASDATVKAVAERLSKAKFVGDKADQAAILKGIDDAVKAGSADATKALRDELAAARAAEDKAKSDLTALREKEASATKAAVDAKADAQKATAELARLTTETAKLKQDATDAIAKATAAEKTATQSRLAAEAAQAEARAATDRTANEVARLKAETDRLTRDLNAVKELADLMKAPAGTTEGPTARPDPDRLAEQFFGDGLRAFHRGQMPEAESAFRKATQFRPNDARFHYLLGLTLWVRKETAGAEAEFEKGRDLELNARPTSRMISAVLERIQGPARHAVDAYRP